jgi:hypothetical protein
MSDILDWLERLSELFILKLLTLGAWSKAYERYRTIPFTEDYLHDQTIDELINIYGRIIEEYLHNQSIDEVINIYGGIIESYLHEQLSDELVVLTIPYSNVSSSAMKIFTPILGTPM